MARQMKDSGIEWIGEIPETWETSRVGLHYSIILGKMLCPNQVSENYTLEPYFCAADVHFDGVSTEGLKQMWFSADEKEAYIVHNGDLLVVEGGAGAGGCAIARNMPRATYIQNSIMIVRKKNGDNRFLRYWIEMLVKRGYIDIVCNKATIPHFTKDKLANVPLPILSDNEMSSIADFLDRKCAEIDAVIERTKATIEEYKKLKQAVITEAVTKGVRSPRPMKDSGIEWLGCIPDEWDCTKLKQVWISVDSGVSVNAADYPTENDTQYGVLKTSCVSKFVFLPHEHKQVDADEYDRVACSVKKDTIIVSRMNTPDLVGACGYVDADYPNLFLPDRLWQIGFHPEVIAKFVWYYLNNQMVRAYISSLSTGTSSSMQNISKPQFGGISLAVPAIEEQHEIVAYLDEKCAALDTLIAKKTDLLTELETYKKSLIHEYVTGKKEVL